MGYKKSDPCLEKAYNDERIFVLMTRDQTSPLVVGEWIKQNIGIQPREKLVEALDCAIEMFNRHEEMGKRKQLEKKGWIFCEKKFPSPDSICEVLFDGNTKGYSHYLSDKEGFRDSGVIAWKNPERAV